MDLSNKELVLEEVKKRFPLGSTVVDKDGDRNIIRSYSNDAIKIESDRIFYWPPAGRACYLYYRDTWSKIVQPAIESAPELASSSPLQTLFKNLINS